MEKISLFLPETTIDMLVHVARKRGISFGDVVRDAVMQEFIASLGDDGPRRVNLPTLTDTAPANALRA